MALDFDGVNDTVTHGDIAAVDGASALSVMCWLWRDTSNGGDARDGVWSKAGAGNTGPYIEFDYTNAGGSLWAIGTSTYAESTSNVWTTGAWTHMAMVFNGAGGDNAARLQIYRNASLQSYSYNGTIPATIPDNGATTVAFARAVNAGSFDGKMALGKMWSAALTAAEVFQEMNSYRPQRTANLILWAPYDDGTSAKDYSGAGNNGTVTQATQIAGPPVSYGG